MYVTTLIDLTSELRPAVEVFHAELPQYVTTAYRRTLTLSHIAQIAPSVEQGSSDAHARALSLADSHRDVASMTGGTLDYPMAEWSAAQTRHVETGPDFPLPEFAV